MGNSSKVESQKLNLKMLDLETENESLKTENAKLKLESSELRSEIQPIKSEMKRMTCHFEENSNGSDTVHGIKSATTEPALQSSEENRPLSKPGTETRDLPASEQPNALFPLTNRFSVLDNNDPGNDDSSLPAPRARTPNFPPNLPRTNQDQNTSKEDHLSSTHHPTPNDSTSNETNSNLNSIALLIDSNGKYIDLDRFSPKSPTHKYFTPTITSTIETLKSNDLRKPTHIIIHTGTNDLDKSTVSQCIYKYQEMVKLVSDKHPSSKIIISSILIRADSLDEQRPELKTKLENLCAPYPNVYLVNNDNISYCMTVYTTANI